MTTFTILQDMAQNVAGEAALVESITKPGAEIHDYEPTPLDVARAQAADLVLWNGFELERWFEKFLQRVKDVPSVVVTDGIKPIDIGEGPSAGRPNPHTWMWPANAVIYVENIRARPGQSGYVKPQRRRLYRATPAAPVQSGHQTSAPDRLDLMVSDVLGGIA